jgi:hypothetical protein
LDEGDVGWNTDSPNQSKDRLEWATRPRVYRLDQCEIDSDTVREQSVIGFMNDVAYADWRR